MVGDTELLATAEAASAASAQAADADAAEAAGATRVQAAAEAAVAAAAAVRVDPEPAQKLPVDRHLQLSSKSSGAKYHDDRSPLMSPHITEGLFPLQARFVVPSCT